MVQFLKRSNRWSPVCTEKIESMCGIAGILDTRDSDPRQSEQLVRRMTDMLAHRGPDGDGLWSDSGGIVLGHRRLAIIDLSEHGRQPMLSADGRWALSYNGEFYNFLDVRRELIAQGVSFKGDSDTEVLLEGCACWGLRATLAKVAGMFAFALWDRRERRLYLARDRLGIKPLYWAQVGTRIIWASEVSAIESVAGDHLHIDQDAVAGLFRFGYIPAPLSIWREARKLSPGTVLEIDARGEPKIDSYWTLSEAVTAARSGPIADPNEAADQLDALLRTVVSQHMISDVPHGAFLSGGIDSSVVTAIMQALSPQPVRSFSIGFEGKAFDEAPYARAVAAHLGTEHTEHYVSDAQALNVVQRLGDLYDEPFADSSQIPTFLVSELARRDVTVALSGDGGDEVFAGYDRYFYYAALHKKLDATGLGNLPLRSLTTPVEWAADAMGLNRAAIRLKRFRLYASQASPSDAYRDMISWSLAAHARNHRASDARLRQAWPSSAELFPERALSQEHMQYLDTLTYLPDDILTKVDRASMAVSLETRVPLLDHRVVELGWRMAPDIKHQGDRGKLVLRQVLERYVPRALFERPKMGFGVPLGQWLRGGLRPWAEALLNSCELAEFGIAPIPQRYWNSLQAGDETFVSTYWTMLMLCAWSVARSGRSARRVPLLAKSA